SVLRSRRDRGRLEATTVRAFLVSCLAGPTVGVTKEAPLSLPAVRKGLSLPNQGRQTAMNARRLRPDNHRTRRPERRPARSRLHRGTRHANSKAIHCAWWELRLWLPN